MLRPISSVSMEKIRSAVVVVLLVLLSLLADLASCYDDEQGTSTRDEDLRSSSVDWVIQGDGTRRFLQGQNKYWSGHFGNKEFTNNAPPAYIGGNLQVTSIPAPATSTQKQQQPYIQWPPAWGSSSAKAPSPMSFPPSLAPAPAPSPVAPKPMMQPRHHRTPAHSIALPPRPATVPSDSDPAVAGAAAGARHSGFTRPVYVIAAAGGSLLAALSVALFVLCYRSSKVVTVRPWATGLSGQLQKAFVTGVPSLKRSELELACEDFSNVIGSLSDYMVYKGTLSSGVEIAVVSTTKSSAKDWSKHCEAQFRKKEEQPFTRMMVFESTHPNGTLCEHLHVREDGHLDWQTRLRVAVGVAYCLEHMHQLSPPEIIRTLDTSTICLTDDFAAKISDVFFCDEPRDELATMASLSPALSDRESVVYSYGMVLLETMTGRFTMSQGGLLEAWAASYLRGERQLRDLMDPSLRRSFHAATVDKLDGVIRGCTDREPRRRLTMPEVARRLREITAMPPDAATPKVSPLWWAELEIISTEVN
ncbi:hypothetical protein PR202_ga04365 [Eleusine coracana subsp. coracana]|uniref:Protein kinase domain-containing protein n=1 Tax=Eleusine coracana subsp. coracana TaxID=191504 RepID=A0AAV5BQQ7_ELECO|nr:hypothetical protein PR202_ga04365 [Eleusine coracana subsp. coracana]